MSMTVRIEHVAVWVHDLEAMKEFYVKYFAASPNERYQNPKGFSSYFLSFSDGARLEIMHMASVAAALPPPDPDHPGFAHVALSVGSQEQVNALTEQLRQDGFIVAGEPRTTGDGYYESVVLDPEGNRVEITE